MSEKQYVKDYKEQILQIKDNLDSITGIIAGLPDCSWKASLNTSQENYLKKVNSFLETSNGLSEEQKAAIAAIKSGKATEAEISALSARMEKREPETSAGSSEQESSKQKVKKGKKN